MIDVSSLPTPSVLKNIDFETILKLDKFLFICESERYKKTIFEKNTYK